jgi:hypothetical protein
LRLVQTHYRLGRARQKAEDFKGAIAAYMQADDIARAYAPAQNSLGAMYANGLGVTKDLTIACKVFRNVASSYPPAANNWGHCLEFGDGVPKNLTEAVTWYRRAAEKDYAAAQYNLGRLYWYGKGVPEDEPKAIFPARQPCGKDWRPFGQWKTKAGAMHSRVKVGPADWHSHLAPPRRRHGSNGDTFAQGTLRTSRRVKDVSLPVLKRARFRSGGHLGKGFLPSIELLESFQAVEEQFRGRPVTSPAWRIVRRGEASPANPSAARSRPRWSEHGPFDHRSSPGYLRIPILLAMST